MTLGLKSRFGQRVRGGRLIALVPLLITIGTLIIILTIGYDSLRRRFGSIQEGAAEHSVATRVDYLKSSWQMFLDHPLTGVGLGSFPAIYPRYGRSSSRYERVEQVHNDYLQLLTDTGIVGGLIFVIAVGWLVSILGRHWQAFDRYPNEDRAVILGATVSVIGLAVHSLFDFNLQIAANALIFLMVLALVFSPPTESVGR